MSEVMGQGMAEESALLLGRKTYDIFATHWPNAGDDNPVTQKLNKTTKYVVTSTPDTLGWENSLAITDNVATKIEKLKQDDGPPLRVLGSSELIQTLLKHRLVDELFVWTFPVVLGSGKCLFDGGAVPEGFELTDV